MYLHLGNDIVKKTDTLIGIFDLDTTTTSKITRQFLAAAEKKGMVVNVSDELPKSFAVCSKNGKAEIFISQISSVTLAKRTEYMDSISNV